VPRGVLFESNLRVAAEENLAASRRHFTVYKHFGKVVDKDVAAKFPYPPHLVIPRGLEVDVAPLEAQARRVEELLAFHPPQRGDPSLDITKPGKTIGPHDGIWRFTPGQRKGIGVSAAVPLYVLQAETASNTVIVGPHESLARRRVDASGRLYVDVGRAAAKLRYRSPAVAAGVAERTGGFTLSLDEPVYGVARGQAAVLYDGDAVVGCGLIASASSN